MNIISPPIFPKNPCCKPIIDQAIDAWNRKDVTGVFVCMENHQYFEFLSYNLWSIINMGLLEEFVVAAYIAPQYNLTNVPFSFLQFVFNCCDKEKTRNLGEKFPFQDSYVVYRGVSGVGRKRRLRGFSWTASFEKAKWFAERFGLEKPMVYKTEIHFDDIYYYSNGRHEQEYVCDISRDVRLKRVWP